jgi:hypothetical protein
MANFSSPSSWRPPTPTPTPRPLDNGILTSIANNLAAGRTFDEGALFDFYRSSSNNARKDMVTQIQSLLPHKHQNEVNNEVLRMGAKILRVSLFPYLQNMNVPPDMVKRMLREEFHTVYGEELSAEVAQDEAVDAHEDEVAGIEEDMDIGDAMDIDPVSDDSMFEMESSDNEAKLDVHEVDPSEPASRDEIEKQPVTNITRMKKFRVGRRLYEVQSLVVRLQVPSISALPDENDEDSVDGPLTKSFMYGPQHRYVFKCLFVTLKFRDPAKIAALASI